MPDTLNDSALKAHLAAVFALVPAAIAVESNESAVSATATSGRIIPD